MSESINLFLRKLVLATGRYARIRIGTFVFVFSFLMCDNHSALASPMSEDPDTNCWGVDGIVYAILRADRTVYIGGSFSNLVSPNGSTRLPAGGLAALDVHTGQPTTWRPLTDGEVKVLTVAPGGSIYVGGNFGKVNGVTRRNFAAISTDGDLLWSCDASSTVRAILVAGNKLYLGGSFGSVQGATRGCLAAIEPPSPGGNTALLLPWSPSVASSNVVVVNGLALANGDLVAAGKFELANGQPSANQARFDPVTGVLKSWRDNLATATKDLTTDGVNYYGALGGGGGRVVCWGPTGNLRWSKKANGDAQAIAFCAGQVIAGGHWDTVGGVAIPVLTAFNPTTGAIDGNWMPRPDLGGRKGVWAIHDGGDHLHVGGGFKFVDTLRMRSYAQFPIPDGQPPTTPTGLTGVGDLTQVDLAWNASIDNGEVVGYEIHRNGSLLATVDTVTNHVDASVSPGTAYTYRVRARDASGLVSGFSNMANVTTPSDTEKPTAPENLTAFVADAGQVDLDWEASSDDNGVAGYRIYRDGVQVAAVGVVTNHTDDTVQPLTDYDYEVRARDFAGNLSDPSNPAAATTPADIEEPATPTALDATPLNATQIRIEWDAAADNVEIAEYDIYRDGAFLLTVGAVTQYTDSGLFPLTPYEYRMLARDGAGNVSALSDPASATTLVDTQDPSKPTGLNVVAFDSTRVDLTWTASTDNVAVTGYKIYRNNNLIITIGAATSHSDTTVSPLRTYSYKLRGLDAAGNTSSASAIKSVTTP